MIPPGLERVFWRALMWLLPLERRLAIARSLTTSAEKDELASKLAARLGKNATPASSARPRMVCLECRGKGTCLTCEGRRPPGAECLRCRFTGVCAACGGLGHVEDPLANMRDSSASTTRDPYDGARWSR